METEFSIHQIAERVGLSVDTLRYYERIGLLEPIRRLPNGHRRYQRRDIDWLELVINLRATGMPLAQIQQFAALRRQGDETAAERLRILERHEQLLEQQIQELQGHLSALQAKITHKRAFLEEHGIHKEAAQTAELRTKLEERHGKD
ncbi:MAG: MerR family transcriptional regulator [Chloroflexota bacterium]